MRSTVRWEAMFSGVLRWLLGLRSQPCALPSWESKGDHGFVGITRKEWGKSRMEFLKIADSDKTKYMDLLLLADEQVSMIEKYLYRGDMFALCDDGVKAICVVTQERPGVFEIKNIVTAPPHRRKGYGQHLLSFIVDYYKEVGNELYVGTGDCPKILRFYEKCGFQRSHVVKDFFVDHYDHPMYEEGKQLVDS